MLSKNTSYLSRLDHLRFLAALLVIAFHFHGNTAVDMDTRNPFLVLIREGESGVSLFMVLSGFILTRIALGKEINYRSFIFNRIVRIYPLYLVAILATAMAGRHVDVLSVIAMVLPIGPIAGVTMSHVSHLWTIPVEFQFYLVFPLLVSFYAKFGARYLLGVIVLAMGFRLMEYLYDDTVMDAAYFSILGRIDQFVIGMLAAVLYAKRPRLMSSPIALVLAFAAVYLWFMVFIRWSGGMTGKDAAASHAWIVSPTMEALTWSALMLAYLQQGWKIPRTVDRVLSYLGVISFSLYVWQSPIIYVFALHPTGQLFTAWQANLFFIELPVIVAASSLSYFVIERPFFAFRTRYVASTEPAVTRSASAALVDAYPSANNR